MVWSATNPGVNGPTHAGQQIADQRRELHLLRERAKNEGDREADGDDVDEAGVVMHSNPL